MNDAQQKTTDVRLYGSDDYAGLTTPKFAFYFGYERTLCSHGKDADCECDNKDWCFTATVGGVEIERYSRTELDKGTDGRLYWDEPYGYLLAGIGRFLK